MNDSLVSTLPVPPGVTRERIFAPAVWLFLCGVALVLGFSRSVHYLLFHTLAELIAITVSFSIFTLAWASRQHLKNGYLIIIGAAYVTIGTVDVFHSLTFKGMNLLPGVTTNYPTQFWLTARFIEAAALMIAPLFVRRQPNFSLAAWGFAIPGAFGCVAVLLGALPETHVEGIGLTQFKVISEYVIIAMLLVGQNLLWRCRNEFTPQVFNLLSGSLLLAVATELCFVHYVGFYDFVNELGHYFRFLSVVLAYFALVVTGVRRPAEVLYRQLSQKETELQRTNTQLSASEASLNKAQAVAGVGSWHLDILNDNRLTWSDETYRLFGIPRGTPQSFETFAAAIHPDDQQRVLAAWNEALNKGATYDIEHRIVVAGNLLWVRERADILRTPTGEPIAGIGTVQDITQQKLAELAVRESEDRYRNLYKNTPAIMHSIDAEGRLLSVSELWLRTLDYSRDEVIGRKSTDFFTSESQRFAIETVLPEFFRTGFVVDIPYQMVTKNGCILDVELSAVCERDANNQIVRSLAVMADVTKRNLAEQALKDAKEYAENLVQTANAMVVQLDQAGNLKHMNRTAEKITGYTLDELRGRNWFEVIVPQDRYPQVWQEFERFVSTDGNAAEFENPILNKQGEERYVIWRNSKIIERGKAVGTLSFGLDATETKAIQDRLMLSEASLAEAQSIAQIGSWAYDLQTRTLSWSDEIYNILELDRSRTAPSGQAFLGIVHPNDRDRVVAAHRKFKDNLRPYDIAFQLLMPDGTTKYVKQHSRIVTGTAGESLRLVGTLQDVTLQTLQEMAFKESEERFRTIADYTYDWEYWQGPHNEILYISPSCKRITGYTSSEFISNPALLMGIVHPDDREMILAHKREIMDKPHGDLVYRIVSKEGEVRWIAHGCQAVFARDGSPLGRRGSNRDITALKQAEQLAQQLAYYDTLTNLPNRRMLMDRMLHALTQAKRFHRALAIMFLDLDRFKQINDTMGHDAGDKLLVEVAARLSKCVREGDTVSRTGGDEFIIVLPEISHPSDATTVAEKILEAIAMPVKIGVHTFDVSTSIGIAVYPVNGTDDAEEMMKKADRAMYAAKQAGRNCYRVFGE